MARTEKFGVLIEGRETVSPAVKKASTGLKGFANTVAAAKMKILALAASLYGLVRAAKAVIAAFRIQEQSVARLTQALKNQNQFSEKNIKILQEQAKALQKLTIFGDEQILSAQAMLASFALTMEQIEEMTPRMLDLATMTAKTTGGMMDLEGAAKFVGMALGGQAGRLTQAGIRLSEFQKKTFKAANETERFNMLIKIFDQNAAGLAESVGKTATGALQQFSNSFGDLKEAIGERATPALSNFTKNVFTPFVEKLSEYIKRQDEIDYSKLVITPETVEDFKTGALAILAVELALENLRTQMEEGTLTIQNFNTAVESAMVAYNELTPQVSALTREQKKGLLAIQEGTKMTRKDTESKIENKEATDDLIKSVRTLTETEAERARRLGGITERPGRPEMAVELENGTWGIPTATNPVKSSEDVTS